MSAEEVGEIERVRVRALQTGDLDAIIRIDRASTGQPRHEYYRVKLERTLREPKLSTSLVAELDGRVVAFVFATLFYGEYGRPEAVAVLDAIGVDPDVRGQHVGSSLMRQLEGNLAALRVERLETLVDWKQIDLLGFLAERGFRPSSRLCLELGLRT